MRPFGVCEAWMPEYSLLTVRDRPSRAELDARQADSNRARAWIDRARHLSEAELSDALAFAATIADGSIRASLLIALAPYLPEPKKNAALQDALDAMKTIQSDLLRTAFISGSFNHLPHELRSAFLSKMNIEAPDNIQNHSKPASPGKSSDGSTIPPLPEKHIISGLYKNIDAVGFGGYVATCETETISTHTKCYNNTYSYDSTGISEKIDNSYISSSSSSDITILSTLIVIGFNSLFASTVGYDTQPDFHSPMSTEGTIDLLLKYIGITSNEERRDLTQQIMLDIEGAQKETLSHSEGQQANTDGLDLLQQLVARACRVSVEDARRALMDLQAKASDVNMNHAKRKTQPGRFGDVPTSLQRRRPYTRRNWSEADLANKKIISEANQIVGSYNYRKGQGEPITEAESEAYRSAKSLLSAVERRQKAAKANHAAPG